MASIESISELESMLGRDLRQYHPTSSSSHDGIDLSGLAQELTRRVKEGDPASIEIACELIEADPHMPFGKLIKSNLARALRQQAGRLLEKDRERVVKRTIELLSLESCPREAEDYCKLIRKLGAPAVGAVVQGTQARCPKSRQLVESLEIGGA